MKYAIFAKSRRLFNAKFVAWVPDPRFLLPQLSPGFSRYHFCDRPAIVLPGDVLPASIPYLGGIIIFRLEYQLQVECIPDFLDQVQLRRSVRAFTK